MVTVFITKLTNMVSEISIAASREFRFCSTEYSNVDSDVGIIGSKKGTARVVPLKGNI
jgi:hypothetical protein